MPDGIFSISFAFISHIDLIKPVSVQKGEVKLAKRLDEPSIPIKSARQIFYCLFSQVATTRGFLLV